MSISEGTIIKIAAALILADETVAMQIFWAVVEDAIGSGPLDETDVLDAVSGYLDNLFAEIEDNMWDEIVPSVVDVWEVDGPTGDLTPIGDTSYTFTPAQVSDQLANGIAAIVQMKTSDTEITGRKFIPGFAESGIEDNNWGSGTLVSLALYAVEWASTWVDPNDVTLVIGVYSNTKNTFAASNGVEVVNGIAGYQRRRKPGVGI